MRDRFRIGHPTFQIETHETAAACELGSVAIV